MTTAVWNLIAGILAAIGGVVFIYLALDATLLVLVGAIIGFLSGIAWTISAIIQVCQQ